MRLVIALLTFGLLASAAVSMPTVVDGGGYVVAAQEPQPPQQPQQPQQEPQQPRQDPQPQQQPQQPSGEVNVDISTSPSGGNWWADPVWIGGGVVALIVLIAIVAFASRSGGTTIVRG